MEHSSFFNSVNGDRKYKAEDFAKYFAAFLTNGIFPNPSTNLQVMANSDMTVTVKAGMAWVNGYFYYNDSDLILPISTADGTLNRIDRIVVKLSTAGRAITAVVKKGTFASSPVAPSLQRDADAYELCTADIYITAGATSITQANITDQRQKQDLCGIVNSLITADTKTLFNQFTDGFNTWFEGIKNTLGSDVAGNLLNQINAVKDDLTSHKADNVYQTAGGTGTAIILTIGETLVNGLPINFIASANNNGAATTINGKPLYKPNTTTAPTLIAGKAYTVWYNSIGNCFFIKASATGTVTSDKVLAGETYSTEVDTDIVGTMPNRGTFNLGLGVNVPEGYYSGGITANGKRWASGTSENISGYANGTVSGLAFSPNSINLYVHSTDDVIKYYVTYTRNSPTGYNQNIAHDGYYNSSPKRASDYMSFLPDGFTLGGGLMAGSEYKYYWYVTE